MKKLFTLAICSIALLSQASAQIKKGEKMLGGSMSFVKTDVKYKYPNQPESNTSETSNLFIAPQFGIGLGNNWIIGIAPGFSFQHQEQGSNPGGLETRSYTINPDVFVRKYTTIGERFGFFGQADIFYGSGKNKFRHPNERWNEDKLTSYGISIKPGAFFRAGKRFIIETTFGNFGYTHTESTPEDRATGIKSSINHLNYSLSNSLSLGFQVVL